MKRPHHLYSVRVKVQTPLRRFVADLLYNFYLQQIEVMEFGLKLRRWQWMCVSVIDQHSERSS